MIALLELLIDKDQYPAERKNFQEKNI